MNEDADSSLSRTTEDIALRNTITTTVSTENSEDVQTSPRSTENDDLSLQCTSTKILTNSNNIEKEPIFVIVDSSCVSNPSSQEILINKRNFVKELNSKKYAKKKVIPITEIPGTSNDPIELMPTLVHESVSREEIQMVEINLQSENNIPVESMDEDNEDESIVIAYLRNKDIILEKEISENSLDVHIPSYPGSPRSLHFGSGHSLDTISDQDLDLREAVEFLHQDKDFLVAAEIGNDRLLEIYISRRTDIQQIDYLGRNALHLAVCSGNLKAVKLLLAAGVNPNVKDNVGMTPLSLCLMTRPSLIVANLLFDYGAKILPRSNPIDSGLFNQFVMMCTPTTEEKNILRLLVDKGAKVNDPDAPGGRQALHFAAMSNNTSLIRLLISLGADLYMTNHRNETPRDVAETFKCKEAYELLYEYEEDEEYIASSSSSATK